MSLTAQDKQALAQWGIHQALLPAGTRWGFQSGFLLQTERGAFALRAYRVTPREKLNWEHRIIQHACAIGIPTPLPIPTDTGASCLDQNGHHYAFFPWIADSTTSTT